MSKEFQDNSKTNNGPDEFSYLPSYLKPKVQSKIQPKVYSKIQPKLMTDLGKQKKQDSGVSSSKLPEEVQAKMENSFSQDFSGVNIHENSSSARNINAMAYTQGSDIHFAPGEYQPSSQPGQELIGHELTHVVQQKQGRVGQGEVHGKGLEINMDPMLEKEADDAGKLASQGNSVPAVSTNKSGIQFKLSRIGNDTLSEITTTGITSSHAKNMGLKKGIEGVEASQQLAEGDWNKVLLYAKIFKEIGDKYGVPGALLAAIASRESGVGSALNEDGYGLYDSNGYGIMQIDKNANPSLTGKEGAHSKEHIETATKIFVKMFEAVKAKHPDWALAWQLRGAVAAYNFGADDVWTKEGLDKGTTGSDYSADIWERAKYYAQKKEFAEAKNDAITTASTATNTTTANVKTRPVTTHANKTAATTTPVTKEYIPVYYKMPEVSESMVCVVGTASRKYTGEIINFSSDVHYLQKKLKDLGLLNEADYDLESGQVGEELFVPTNFERLETEEPVPLLAIEKKFMDQYGKIPVGPQLSVEMIPETIQAIRSYQREVMQGVVDGNVSSTGPTMNSIKINTAEQVAIARQKYTVKKKHEEEAARKKKEEERQKQEKLVREQEALKKQQAYIAALKSVGSDKESVKKIYDVNSYDMRVLGKEMRKYAPHNPKLVIAMLNYMGYTDSDNLAYNISSNFTDAELGTLSNELLNELKAYLDGGWTSEAEQKQIDRINNVKGSTVTKISTPTNSAKTTTNTNPVAKDKVAITGHVVPGGIKKIESDKSKNFDKASIRTSNSYKSNSKASSLYGKNEARKLGYITHDEKGTTLEYKYTNKSFASLEDYYKALDAFYEARDKDAEDKRTDPQKEILAFAREASNNDDFFNKIVTSGNASDAMIDYSNSKLSWEGNVLSAVLKHRVEKMHKFLVSFGLYSKKIKVGPQSAVRSRKAAHQFSVEYVVLNKLYKSDIIENFKKMYSDSKYQDGNKIIDTDKNTWTFKEHFVDSNKAPIGNDLSRLNTEHTFTNILNYVNTKNYRSGSNRYDAASEGYDPGNASRLPNTSSGITVSPHITGWALDLSRHYFTEGFMNDQIIDYICFEFGLVRNVKNEQWHFQATSKPITNLDFDH